MTEEEIKVLETELESAKNQLLETEKRLSEITIERDSLLTENDDFRKKLDESSVELKKTKEMNYSLARAVNVGSKKTDPEKLIKDMFK